MDSTGILPNLIRRIFIRFEKKKIKVNPIVEPEINFEFDINVNIDYGKCILYPNTEKMLNLYF